MSVQSSLLQEYTYIILYIIIHVLIFIDMNKTHFTTKKNNGDIEMIGAELGTPFRGLDAGRPIYRQVPLLYKIKLLLTCFYYR